MGPCCHSCAWPVRFTWIPISRLSRISSKLEAIAANTPTASAEEKKRSMALADEAGALLKPAIALLEQAASVDHPVAQYRLGLIYVMLYPSEVIKEKACPSLLAPSSMSALGCAAFHISRVCMQL